MQTSATHSRVFGRPAIRVAASLVGVAGMFVFSLGSASASVSARVGGVAGQVLSKATGAPVAGATVTLPEDGLRTVSDRAGRFAFGRRVSTRFPYRRLVAVVTAPGYGRWTIEGVPLYPGDTLELRAELSHVPFTHRVLTPAERAAAAPAAAASLTTRSATCTGWTSDLVPPKTIAVLDTSSGTSTRYDFVFYMRHVLPDEWIASWLGDALGAGAAAVKDFAWWRTKPGNARSSGTGCYDIRDDQYDQVFDPTWSNAATDQAVYATLGSLLWRSGSVFMAQYYSGSSSDKCQAVTGTYAGRMSQWGTEACAKGGMRWSDIVPVYYSGITWTYLDNLILDPTVEDPNTYAWLHTSGSNVTRTQGGAYGGSYYFTMSGTLYQVRPFDGLSGTLYHLKVALKCGSPNTTACPVTVKVIANKADGSIAYASAHLSVPHDNTWRLYYFNPSALGVGHVSVQVNIVTTRTIGLDNLTLTSSTGP